MCYHGNTKIGVVLVYTLYGKIISESDVCAVCFVAVFTVFRNFAERKIKWLWTSVRDVILSTRVNTHKHTHVGIDVLLRTLPDIILKGTVQHLTNQMDLFSSMAHDKWLNILHSDI